MRFTANEYLDRRHPGWLDAEVSGSVRYDWHRELQAGSRLVEVSDSRRDIQDAVAGGPHTAAMLREQQRRSR